MTRIYIARRSSIGRRKIIGRLSFAGVSQSEREFRVDDDPALAWLGVSNIDFSIRVERMSDRSRAKGMVCILIVRIQLLLCDDRV
jgi:hypothetical protein